MSDDDRRRRQYVPLDVYFMAGKTGTRLQQEYGLEGLAVFVALLAAAKRGNPQGSFTWISEPDAWHQLGIASHPPNFTFRDFVKLLGRLKQTRITSSGTQITSTFTHWEDWNNTPKRANDALRMRRKRAQNTGDYPATIQRPYSVEIATEGEGEGETPYPLFKGKSKPSNNGTHSDLACPQCGVHCRTLAELEDHLTYVHPDPPAHPRWQDDLVDAGELDRLNQLYGDTT